MRSQKGYVAGYNGQLVVTTGQVIVGAMLSRHPVDRTLLHPLLDRCRDQLAAAGIRPKLRTRAGRLRLRQRADLRPRRRRWAARAAGQRPRPALRPNSPAGPAPGPVPSHRPRRRRLQHPRGRDDYKLRARTVEPVFGQLKTCQKVTMMSRRGLAACENEWLLAWAAHNLRKLHRYRLED